MKVKVSHHAEQRMRERLGLNKKSIERIAQRALDKGISHNQTKGNLKKWVTGTWAKNKNANNIKIYGDKCFIFHDELLITVIQLPRDLFKDLDYLIRR